MTLGFIRKNIVTTGICQTLAKMPRICQSLANPLRGVACQRMGALTRFAKHWQKCPGFAKDWQIRKWVQHTGQASRLRRWQIAVLAVLLLAGCSQKEAADPLAAAPAQIPAGEAAAVRAVLEPEQIHIGDIATLTTFVLVPEGTQVGFPDLADAKNVIIREIPVSELLPRGEGLALAVQTTRLTSLVVSNHIIGEGREIELVDAAGARVKIAYPFAALHVVSSLQGEEDRELRPADTTLLDWPKPRSYKLLIALGILLAMAAAFFAARFALRRAVAPPPPPPPIPPHEAAMQALAALKASGWMEEGAFEPFYTALSDIVRRYMEGRFHLRAPERTTEEFIREAANAAALSVAHRRLVSDFLTQSDLVKFARHEPTRADMQNAFASAENLVAETTPTPAPEAAPQPER